MESLNKKRLNKIIREEVHTLRHEINWHQRVRPALIEAQQDYLQLGFDRHEANKHVINEFFGPFAKMLGGAAAGGGGGSSALGLASAGEGFKTAIEVKALDTLVRAMGLHPYRGMGVVVKSCLGEVIDTFEEGEIQSLFTSSAGCKPIARNIAAKFLECLEGALSARLVAAITDAILGELGDDFRDSALTGALYKNLEDSVKNYVETFITSSGIEDEIAEMICDNLNLDNLLGKGVDFISQAGGSIFDDISSGLKNLEFSGLGNLFEE